MPHVATAYVLFVNPGEKCVRDTAFGSVPTPYEYQVHSLVSCIRLSDSML